MSDHTPQTPRQRAAIDIMAALVSLEETADTLRNGGLHELAVDVRAVRSWLENLRERVEQ